METTRSSETVRLNNEALGSLQRSLNEIVRRVEAGNIPLEDAKKGLQRIIEGRQLPEVQYRPTAPPLDFERPPEKERIKSHGALARRLPHSLHRLNFPQRNPEIIIAELWEAECIPSGSWDAGATYINAILGERHPPTEHEVCIINSTIQWLGTHIGQSFVRKFLGVSQIQVK